MTNDNHNQQKFNEIRTRYRAVGGGDISEREMVSVIADPHHPVRLAIGNGARATLAKLGALPKMSADDPASVARWFAALGDRAAVALLAARELPHAHATLTAALSSVEAILGAALSRGSLDDAAWLSAARSKANVVRQLASELTAKPIAKAAATKAPELVHSAKFAQLAADTAERDGIPLSKAMQDTVSAMVRKALSAKH